MAKAILQQHLTIRHASGVIRACILIFRSYSHTKRIEKQDLLILDDFGLEKLDTVSRLFLLEILEDRHSIKSTILTSQLPVSSWHKVIGDPTISDAICDRIIHNSCRIELTGDSVRKIYKNLGNSPLKFTLICSLTI